MKNQVQLCTYIDRFGKGDLDTLAGLLRGPLDGVFGGVHLLPFYYPIDGADAGFDPIDHTVVDERVGDWDKVAALAQSHDIMADVIVNHMSSGSPQFQDYLKNGEASRYADLFLTFDKVFPAGASEQQLLNLYRPRPGLPFSRVKFVDGHERLLWTTFTADQIDIDVNSQSGQAYLTAILDRLRDAGVNAIRLDAAGYAIKKAGSRCFMTEDTFAFIEAFSAQAAARGIEVLVEIHAHYMTQIAIARKVDRVYDFALPPLVLHTLIAGDSKPLQHWYQIAPRNSITVLDTHDGIGIIDIAAEKGVGPGLLSDAQVDELVEAIHRNSNGNSRKATGVAASNVDLYQVNCTFYDALGGDDDSYLLARLIQLFSPGIPQIYYVGLMAGENDMELLQRTSVGRDINRHYYSRNEIDEALGRDVVRRLLAMIRFRNRHPVFADGSFSCSTSDGGSLEIVWQGADVGVALTVNLADKKFLVRELGGELPIEIRNWDDFDNWQE